MLSRNSSFLIHRRPSHLSCNEHAMAGAFQGLPLLGLWRW